jgi:hypothetical protein
MKESFALLGRYTAYQAHLHVSSSLELLKTWKMRLTDCPETPAAGYQSMLHNIPEQ